MNKTFRPQARSSFCIEERAGPPYDDEDGSEEEAAEIERTGGTVNFFVCGCKDVYAIFFSFFKIKINIQAISDQGKILLFVKFFDEVKNSLEYVAHIHAGFFFFERSFEKSFFFNLSPRTRQTFSRSPSCQLSNSLC